MKLSIKIFVTRVFFISSVLCTMFVGCLLGVVTDEEIDAHYSDPARRERHARVERNIAKEELLPGELFITQSENHSWLNEKNDGSLYVVGDCNSHALARWVHQVCLKYETERVKFNALSEEEKEGYKGDWKDSFSARRDYGNVWRECLPANFRKRLPVNMDERDPVKQLSEMSIKYVGRKIRRRYGGLFRREIRGRYRGLFHGLNRLVMTIIKKKLKKSVKKLYVSTWSRFIRVKQV